MPLHSEGGTWNLAAVFGLSKSHVNKLPGGSIGWSGQIRGSSVFGFLCSGGTLPNDLAFLHHECNTLCCRDIRSWIARHGNYISQFSFFQRANFLTDPQKFGIVSSS